MAIDPQDIIGALCGQLRVEKYLGSRTKKWPSKTRRIHEYECSCSCGVTVVVRRLFLVTKHTRSCGCLRKRKGPNSPSWAGEGLISGKFWSSIRNHAVKRGLDFTLTKEEAWSQFEKQQRCCALTGWSLVLLRPKNSGAERTASLDRVDSTRGYHADNVQWLHKDVNRAKWDLTQERFKEVCRAVVSNE